MKRLLLTLALTLAPPCHGQMLQAIVGQTSAVSANVAFNAASVMKSGTSTTGTSAAFTINAGNNRACVVGLTMSANNATGISCSCGGQTASLVTGTDTGTAETTRTMLFAAANPATGSQTASCSWTTSMGFAFGAIVANNVDQSTPMNNGTFATQHNPSPAALSLSVTSTNGDLTTTTAKAGSAWVGAGTNQASGEVWGDTTRGADYGPGTGTTTHTWTVAFINQTILASGANFKKAP